MKKIWLYKKRDW